MEKPRGQKEMLRNIEQLGLHNAASDWILVSDKWKGTLAAVKEYREKHGLTETTFPHEIVNHSEGEIVNARGFTTNHIEAKWSVLKRWLRARLGGALPRGNDRSTWRAYILEFQFRKFIAPDVRLDRLQVGDALQATPFVSVCHAIATYRRFWFLPSRSSLPKGCVRSLKTGGFFGVEARCRRVVCAR